VHATEDRAKVLKAVWNLFPRDAEFPNYSETKLNGFFGDPITTMRFIVKHRRPATELLEQIIQNLSSLDYFTLLDELPQRFDDTKNMYLRFDKQKAFLGKLLLDRHDAIRLKISFLIPHKADPAEVIKEHMEKIRR
jgi:RNA binding exosome subunit